MNQKALNLLEKIKKERKEEVAMKTREQRKRERAGESQASFSLYPYTAHWKQTSLSHKTEEEKQEKEKEEEEALGKVSDCPSLLLFLSLSVDVPTYLRVDLFDLFM